MKHNKKPRTVRHFQTKNHYTPSWHWLCWERVNQILLTHQGSSDIIPSKQDAEESPLKVRTQNATPGKKGMN